MAGGQRKPLRVHFLSSEVTGNAGISRLTCVQLSDPPREKVRVAQRGPVLEREATLCQAHGQELDRYVGSFKFLKFVLCYKNS